MNKPMRDGPGCQVRLWSKYLLAWLAFGWAVPVAAQEASPGTDLDLPPGLLQGSPVLRRWLEKPPNLQQDIRRDPSFPTRIQVGVIRSQQDRNFGVQVGVEDVFVGRSGLSFSSLYQQISDNNRFQVNARYYLLPLGSRLNLAPQVGYGFAHLDDRSSSGLDLGYKAILVLSRGSADLSFGQSWTQPGSKDQTRLTRLGASYAVTRNLRLATDFQWQRTGDHTDRRVGVFLEWSP